MFLRYLIRFLRWTKLYEKSFKRYGELVTKKLKVRQAEFLGLFESDADNRRLYLSAVLAWKRLRITWIANYRKIVAFEMMKRTVSITIALLVFVILPCFYWTFYIEEFNGFWWGLLYFLCHAACVILLNFISKPLERLVVKADSKWMLYLILLVGYVGSLVWLSFVTQQYNYMFLVLVVSGAALAIALAVVIVIIVLLPIIFVVGKLLGKRKFSSARIHLIYFLSITYSEHKRGRWRYYLKRRNNILGDLEQIAQILERDVPLAHKTYDTSTQSWLKHSYAEMAQAIRNLKKEVCVPGPESTELVSNQLFNLLQGAVLNDWKMIARAPLPKSSAVSQFRKVLNFTVPAFLPLTLALLSMYFQWPKIDKPYQTGLFVFTGIWALVCTFHAMDPNFQSKLESVRSLINLNPLKRNKKDD